MGASRYRRLAISVLALALIAAATALWWRASESGATSGPFNTPALSAASEVDPRDPARGSAVQRAASSPSGPPGGSVSGTAVVGRVEIAPQWRTRIAPKQEVVVAAFAIDGPRIPLAERRFPATALPLEFRLDDSDFVNPAFRLSKAVQLVVVARVVAPGRSATERGDFEGSSESVASGSHGVLVRIDRVVP